MIRILYLVLTISLVFLSGVSAEGRTIKGIVMNQDSMPLNRAIVQIMNDGRPLHYTTTSSNGSYRIIVDSIEAESSLRISKYGYESTSAHITSDSVYNIMLFTKATDLKEVVVRAPHTRVKGDTIVYDVAALTSAADRNIGDIIRKIPGVSIQDQVIYYNGEPINRFYIEGLNMLGGDYSIATNNINPNDISSISVYERHQPKKVLQNLMMSEKAALNLKLKRNSLLRPIGYLQGGIGMDFDKEILFKGNLYGMLVSPVNQTLISADINNAGELLPSGSRGKSPFATSAASIIEILPLGSADIPQSHYYRNNTRDIEGSTLFKFNNDITFSLRAFYGHENDSYSNASSRRYLASGKEDVIYSDVGHTILRDGHLGAEAKIERNSENNYLQDVLRFNGIRSNNTYSISSVSDGLETFRSKEMSLTNSFNTIVRRGSNLFEVDSEISYADIPDSKMHYNVDSSQTPTIAQLISGKRFAGNVKGCYGYAFHNLLLGGEVSCEYDHEVFKSFSGSPEQSKNDVRGYNIKAALKPYVEWKISTFRWRTELEASYRNIRYRSFDNDRIFRHGSPYLEGSTNMYWRASALFHINASFGIRNTFGGIRDFIESPIYTSYRNRTVLGNGELAKALSLRYSLGVTYSNPLQGLVCRALMVYNDSRKNALASSSVDSDGNIMTSNVSEFNKGRSLVWNVDVSKKLTDSNIIFKIFANGMSTGSRRIRQDKAIRVATNLVNVDAIGVINLFSNRLSIDVSCGYSYSGQCLKPLGETSHINDFKETCKVSWQILPYLELYGGLNGRQSRMENDSYRNYLFVDGGCRFKKTKYEIELAGRNLANIHKYEYHTMLPLEINSYSYTLRPCELILTFKWIF